ncbi:hypothetical protein Tco_0310713, partial [Tanacetum coccineum]
LCSFCSVFGHKVDTCGCRPKTVEEIEAIKEKAWIKEEAKRRDTDEVFVQVNRKKAASVKKPVRNADHMQGTKKNNVTYQPAKKKVTVEESIGNISDNMETGKSTQVENGNPSTSNKWTQVENGSPNTSNKWNVNQDIFDSIRRSANKFSVLSDDPGDERAKENVSEVITEEDDAFVDLNRSASKIARNELNSS